jgi:hypothetical protein
MRYPAAEKLEIIRLVGQSPLPARRTLAQLGIPRATFMQGVVIWGTIVVVDLLIERAMYPFLYEPQP